MKNPPLISSASLRATIAALRSVSAYDLIPQLETLLMRDAVQKGGDSSSDMFAVSLDQIEATIICDHLKIVEHDSDCPKVFQGRKISDLSNEWQGCVSLL